MKPHKVLSNTANSMFNSIALQSKFRLQLIVQLFIGVQLVCGMIWNKIKKRLDSANSRAMRHQFDQEVAAKHKPRQKCRQVLLQIEPQDQTMNRQNQNPINNVYYRTQDWVLPASLSTQKRIVACSSSLITPAPSPLPLHFRSSVYL